MTKEEKEKLNNSLLFACNFGNFKGVQDFIDKGADVNAKSSAPAFGSSFKLNDTPLHIASFHGVLDIVKYLIDHGARINARNASQETPLHRSIFKNLEVVKYLIEKDALIDAQDIAGNTPLINASFSGKLAVVKYLCEKGANVEAKNIREQTSLNAAVATNEDETVKYLFLERNALMSIYGMFKFTELMKEKMRRETDAQSILDYFLQNKSKYKLVKIQEFKKKFLDFQMDEEDTRNLKSIVKFL